MAVSPAVTAALITAAVGVGTTVYAASNQPKSPKMPVLPEAPKLPNRQNMAGYAQQADARARSAGGTILSDPKANAGIADGANATRKTLLGT